MPNWLQIIALISIVLAVALVWDQWRTTRLRAWAVKHQATLHWPVELARHPEIPAAAFAARLERQVWLRWAGAMEAQVDGRSAWVLEYEARPSALKTGRWYCLCLLQAKDPIDAQAMLESRSRGGQARADTFGEWLVLRRDGLMTAGLLDQWF